MIVNASIEYDPFKELEYQFQFTFVEESSGERNCRVRFGKQVSIKDFANLLRDIADSIDKEDK